MMKPDYLDMVSKRFNVARQNQVAWFNKFTRWYGLYRNYQSLKNYYGRSNLFIPASFWTIESYVPRVSRSLRGIVAKSQSEKDHQNEKTITELLEYQKNKINWDDFMQNWIRGAGIYGSYLAKVGWDFENDLPDVSLVDIVDVFFDPAGTRIENCRWVIHRTQKHIEDLRRMKDADGNELYKDLDKIMPRGSAPQDEGFKTQRKGILSVAARPYDSSAKMVDIYEFMGWIPNDNQDPMARESNMLITVANKNTVIRAVENPFADILDGNALPYAMLYDTDTPHELYGIGEIEPIESLQMELNDTRNQRMDNVSLVLNRMWEVVRGADISEDDFVSIPGKVFYSNIPGGIKPLETPDVTGSALNEEKIIKQDIQQTTTGTPNVDIPTAQQSETATGIMAVQEAGDTRTEYKVRNFKKAVQQLWSIILKLDQKLIDKKYVIRLEGQQGAYWKEITPAEIKGEFEVSVEVESQQNRLVKKQEAMQLLQLAMKIPGGNVGQMFKDTLELFDKENPDEYYQQPQPQSPQPAISISMRGELSEMEVDDFARMAGASPTSTDPVLRPNLRRLMFPDSKEAPLHDEKQPQSGPMSAAAASSPGGAPQQPPQGGPNGY